MSCFTTLCFDIGSRPTLFCFSSLNSSLLCFMLPHFCGVLFYLVFNASFFSACFALCYCALLVFVWLGVTLLSCTLLCFTLIDITRCISLALKYYTLCAFSNVADTSRRRSSTPGIWLTSQRLSLPHQVTRSTTDA